MDADRWVARHRIGAVICVGVLLIAVGAVVAPRATARPGQEDPSTDGRGAGSAEAERGVLDIDVDVANDDAETVAEALADVTTNVADQLADLQSAQDAVDAALLTLAERDAAVADTEMRIEELTERSDRVVIDAFTSPPADAALDAMLTQSAVDATVKQTIVDMQADADADVLEELDAARDDLEEQRERQEAAAGEADRARADAEASLAALEGAVSQHTRFVLDVQARVEAGSDPAQQADDPELAGQIRTLAGALEDIEALERLAEAEEQLQRARQEAIARGEIVCPVDGGGLNFIDSWGFARSGGRSHKGTDMMAAMGTPTVAPTNGQVVHRENSLGGLVWYVYGTNGHTYYGAHLSAFENVGVGYVEAGTVIGYVGDTGNARGTPPHLHFEFQPGGGESVNPYEILDRACPSH